jgi:hypothetical protein
LRAENTVYIRTLWVKYGYTDRERLMPELAVAVDEYLLDQNPDAWATEVGRFEKCNGEEVVERREVILRIDEQRLLDEFEPTVIPGQVRTASPE